MTIISRPDSAIAESQHESRRLLYIDRAKGLVIVLVVFGHIAARTSPPGNPWFDEVKRLIYMFHMPLFLFLSGYVFWFSGAVQRALSNYKQFVEKRAQRYLVPFVLVGLIVVIAKIVLSNFVFVDSIPDNIFSGFLNLFYNTWDSPALFIWYLFAIFFYSCTFPAMYYIFSENVILILILSVILYFLKLPPLLYADIVGRYLFFFVLGVLASKNYSIFERLCKYGYAVVPLFVASMIYYFYFDDYSSALIVGLLSVLPIFWLVRFGPLRMTKWTLNLGAYTLSIYLINVMAIGVVKAVILKFLPWGGPSFPGVAVVLLLSGLFIPILVKRYLFARMPYIDKMTS